MLEKKIEAALKNRIAAIGGKAYKWTSPGNTGVPDRIVIYKGRIYLVELKAPGNGLTPRQEVVHAELRHLGITDLYTLYSLTDVDKFIQIILINELI